MSQRLQTLVRFESLFLRLATYLQLALKDLRLDLRLEHKDLRLTRDSTLKTRDLLTAIRHIMTDTWRVKRCIIIIIIISPYVTHESS